MKPNPQSRFLTRLAEKRHSDPNLRFQEIAQQVRLNLLRINQRGLLPLA